MDRENQRITLTKRLLKESMLRLLKEKELDKISVTELCRDAGINRATFYRHYEIPRDVLIEIEKNLYHELKTSIPLPQSSGDIRQSIEQLCSFMEHHMDLLGIIIRCNSDTDFLTFVNEIYIENWSEYSKLPAFKKLDPADIKLLTLYCAGGSYFVLRHWMLGNIQKSAKEIAAYVYELLNKTDWALLSGQLGLMP